MAPKIVSWIRKLYNLATQINCENRWKCLTSSFRKCEENNNKSGRSRHICYAMFTPARFVTQCLLVRGPRIPTGVFLCRQSELFRAFCSNHSYSRIVGKKNALLVSITKETVYRLLNLAFFKMETFFLLNNDNILEDSSILLFSEIIIFMFNW